MLIMMMIFDTLAKNNSFDIILCSFIFYIMKKQINHPTSKIEYKVGPRKMRDSVYIYAVCMKQCLTCHNTDFSLEVVSSISFVWSFFCDLAC